MCQPLPLLYPSPGRGERHVPRRAAIGGFHYRAAQDVHGPRAAGGPAGRDAGSDRIPGEYVLLGVGEIEYHIEYMPLGVG